MDTANDPVEGGIVGRRPSRREVLRKGASIAAATSAMSLLAGDAPAEGRDADAATFYRLVRAIHDPRRRILLRGATIISMDPAVGDFVRADLLIEGKRIASIDPDLSAVVRDGNAILVDCEGTILIPGPASWPHSQQRDDRRLHGRNPSWLRTILSAGRHAVSASTMRQPTARTCSQKCESRFTCNAGQYTAPAHVRTPSFLPCSQCAIC
jgi:hypothetical protein